MRRSKNYNERRDDAGCIVTFVDPATLTTITKHYGGFATAAVEAACNYCDGLGPTWRILSISTPRTILRDLQGARGVERRDGHVRFAMPESHLLAKVYRLDLLDESLIPPSADDRTYGVFA